MCHNFISGCMKCFLSYELYFLAKATAYVVVVNYCHLPLYDNDSALTLCECLPTSDGGKGGELACKDSLICDLFYTKKIK